jgi:hypothetical protein
VDVENFSTKRIANMKKYAATEGYMRITGAAGKAPVFISELIPYQADPKLHLKQIPDEQVYDDVIALAKFLSHELKK